MAGKSSGDTVLTTRRPRMVVLKSEALEMQEAYEQLDELEQKESFFEKGTSMQLQRTEVCTLLD